jgi:hypothetical protein
MNRKGGRQATKKRKRKEHKAIVPVLSYAPYNEHICKSGGRAPPFLTLALDGGDWTASHPKSSIPGGRGPIPVVLMLGGPPEPFLCWELNLNSSVVHPIT